MPTLTRRHFLAGCAMGVAVPITACSAQAVAGGQFTPEAFGAAGDGVSDDYDALARMVRAVNIARGGSVAFAAGRTYFLNRFVDAGSAIADLTFEDCDGLTIEGNGATISVKGDFRRDRASTRSLSGLRFRNCRRIALRRLELAGNVDKTLRAGQLAEPPSHGLIFQSCSEVAIDTVIARHFAGDGLYIRESKRRNSSGTREASRRFTVRNSRFLFNARQGLSVSQLRGALFENCDFSHTGFVDSAGNSGPYGAHSPSAGVDIEPKGTPHAGERLDILTGDIVFRRCRMVGNYGSALVAAQVVDGQNFLEQVRLESCHLECNSGLSGGRDGFIFDVPGGAVVDCTLQMRDKVAYLGWYPGSEASPDFQGNTVYGRNPKRHHPLFEVRPTRGAPVIERNRFIGQHRQAKALSGSWLVFINNPNAIVRENQVLVPAEAYQRSGTMIPAVVSNARLMEGNTYETTLGGPRDPESGFFGILYGSATVARNEVFRGTRPGPADTIRPVNSATRSVWSHDTRKPWSRF